MEIGILHRIERRSRAPELTPAEYANEVIELIRLKRRLKFPSYELVRVLGCSRVLTDMPNDSDFAYDYDDGFSGGVRDFCHISFNAKPIYTNRNCGGDGEVFIFAELVDKGYAAFDLSYYWVSNLDDPGISFGCGICPHEKEYPHPPATIVKGYVFAQCDYKPLDDFSKRVMATYLQRRITFLLLHGRKLQRINMVGYDGGWPDQSLFSPLLSDPEYAELALKGINEKEDVEFELEKTSGASRRILLLDYFGHWCHVCFTAKPKNDATSSVRFFAELLDAGDGMHLNAYSRLDSTGVMEGGTGTLRGSEEEEEEETAKSEIRWRVSELTPVEYAKEVIELIRLKRRLKFPNYELVRVLGCSRVLANKLDDSDSGYDYDDGFPDGVRDFCHISFIAKPIYTSRNCGGDGEVFIFAELVDKGYVSFDLSYYWVSNLDDPGISFGCGICPHEKEYPHPPATIVKGYVFAQCDYKPLDDTSKTLMANSFKRRVMLFQLRGMKLQLINSVGYDFGFPDESSFSPRLSDPEYAELALKDINEKEDAEFELENTSGASQRMLLLDYFADWCHVCFTAKPKNDATSSVSFFAELVDAGDGVHLNAYARLDSTEKVLYGCGMCPSYRGFPHPSIASYTCSNLPTFLTMGRVEPLLERSDSDSYGSDAIDGSDSDCSYADYA